MAKKNYTKDDSVWKAMKKNLRANKAQISVGWFEGQSYGSDNNFLPMAQVAKWVEEGHMNGGMFAGTYTPPRPAIRTYFIPVIAEADEFTKAAMPMIDMVAQGKMTWKSLHMKLAPKVLNIFKDSLRIYNAIPNRPATVSLKGFNDPWRETGALIESARFKIESYKLYPSKAYQISPLMF